MSFDDFTIVTVGRNDYMICFGGITKIDVVNSMKIVDLSEKC